jgi:integrase
MKPFRSKGAKTHKARIYGSCCLSRPRRCTKPGHVKSLGITDPAEAEAVGRLLAKIRKHERYWPLLDAIIDETPHFGARDLLIASRTKRGVKALLRRLSDVDLEPLIDVWFKALKKSVEQDTREHYRSAVRQVIPPMRRFPSSRLTAAYLQDAIDGWDVAPGTARKRGMGIRQFTNWLRRKKILRRDPMKDVKLPGAGDPRDIYAEPWEAEKIAEAQPWPYSALSLLLAGTGLEVSVALRLTRRDVDTTNKEIRAAGTKTWNRKRVVRVADFAWPTVLRLIEGTLPDAKLFAEIPDRWRALDMHNLAIYGDKEQGVTGLIDTMPRLRGYTPRDARHTWAVRAVRAGVPLDVVAKQLGHRNSHLVSKVYGQHEPTQQERDRAERLASAADVLRKQESEQ